MAELTKEQIEHLRTLPPIGMRVEAIQCALAMAARYVELRPLAQEAMTVCAGLYAGTDWELAPAIRTKLHELAEQLRVALLTPPGEEAPNAG